jgi:hypothetical protein
LKEGNAKTVLIFNSDVDSRRSFISLEIKRVVYRIGSIFNSKRRRFQCAIKLTLSSGFTLLLLHTLKKKVPIPKP